MILTGVSHNSKTLQILSFRTQNWYSNTLSRCSGHHKYDSFPYNTNTVIIGLFYIGVRDGTLSLGTGHRAKTNFK